MTTIDIGYKPRPEQANVHKNPSRFKVLVCHRRFGKTVFSIAELIDKGLRAPKRMAAPRFGYVAPTYKQAKYIAWDYLKAYTAPIPFAKKNEQDLSVTFGHTGASIRLYGADNPDSLRGGYLDGVVLDEVGMMKQSVWGEVIRPMLADYAGWATFIGTPAGKNFFYDLHQLGEKGEEGWASFTHRASETGYIEEGELRSAKKTMTEDEYAQEFECSFEASVRGAVYGKWIDELKRDGRVTGVPYEDRMPVYTSWDLGMADHTAIWFVQIYGQEVRFIDYYENYGEGLQHYINVLNDKPYRYAKHFGPHDIMVRELGTGKSRYEVAHDMGVAFEMTPNLPLADGIQAGRNLLPKAYFDERKCGEALDMLSLYRYEYDDRNGVFKRQPLHDWTSHCADSFRYMAINITQNLMCAGVGGGYGAHNQATVINPEQTWSVF